MSQQARTFSSLKWPLWGLYLLLACLFFPFYCYYIDSADGIQYLEIAQVYAEKGFNQPNAYWSPLLSCLLIPFVSCGIDPLFSLKLVQLLLGFLLYLMLLRRFSQLNLPRYMLMALTFCCVLLCLHYALLYATPDLLFLFILVVIVSLLEFSPLNYTQSMWLGICGALLYLAKSAGFFIFPVLLCSTYLYRRFSLHRKESAPKYLYSIAIFFILGSGWISALSSEGFRIGSAGRYNMDILAPAINPDLYAELQHPITKDTLIPPPAGASSSWIDPGQYQLPHWSPFRDKERFHWYGRIIWRNLQSLRSFFLGFDAGTLIILALLFLYFKKRQSFHLILQSTQFHLSAAFLLCGFYCLVFVQPRYVWYVNIVLLFLLSGICSLTYAYVRIPTFLFLLVTLTFLLMNPISEFMAHFGEGKRLLQFIHTHPVKGRLASVHNENVDDYTLSNLLAFYNRANYLGRLCAGDSCAAVNLAQLQKYHVDYVLTFAPSALDQSLKQAAYEVLQDKESGITLYHFSGY